MTGIVLFRSDDLIVRRVPAGDGRTCFVTFGSYTNEYDLTRQGFGEDFLRDEGLTAIHVINRDNRWYQYPEITAALAEVAAAVAPAQQIFTYGSSMGGYAALRFARTVGARTAVAISPQFSLDPRVVPFEDRWQADLARITFIEGAFAPTERQIVFYDTRLAQDAAHAAMFDVPGTETVMVGIPHAGHPVGPILAETGVLKTAIRAIVEGRFDPVAVQRAVRERRRRSQHHYFTLARRTEHSRPEVHIALLRRAAAIEPESHILSALAAALDRRGDHAEARPLHRAAILKVPSNVRAQVNYARHLEWTGRPKAAAKMIGHALIGQTGSVRLLVRVVQVRMALRRWHLKPVDSAFGKVVDAVRLSPRYGRFTRWLGRTVR